MQRRLARSGFSTLRFGYASARAYLTQNAACLARFIEERLQPAGPQWYAIRPEDARRALVPLHVHAVIAEDVVHQSRRNS